MSGCSILLKQPEIHSNQALDSIEIIESLIGILGYKVSALIGRWKLSSERDTAVLNCRRDETDSCEKCLILGCVEPVIET